MSDLAVMDPTYHCAESFQTIFFGERFPKLFLFLFAVLHRFLESYRCLFKSFA